VSYQFLHYIKILFCLAYKNSSPNIFKSKSQNNIESKNESENKYEKIKVRVTRNKGKYHFDVTMVEVSYSLLTYRPPRFLLPIF